MRSLNVAAFFPQIYPDELIFSAVSRYHDRLAYRSARATARDLFNTSIVRVGFDLPGGMGRLCDSMPLNHNYSDIRLITDHTLYRLYAAFMSPNRAAILRNDMSKRLGGAAQARAGTLTTKQKIEFLRYCSECVREDRERWDETYWHRVHNIPGVEICVTHNIFLESTDVRTARQASPEIFITADKAIDRTPSAGTKCTDPTLLKLAADLIRILKTQLLSSGPDVNLNRYLQLLIRKGLATKRGIVSLTRLENDFREFYSPALLHRLCADLDRNWLRRIVQSGDHIPPAILHALLLNFLGCDVGSFFLISPIDLTRRSRKTNLVVKPLSREHLRRRRDVDWNSLRAKLRTCVRENRSAGRSQLTTIVGVADYSYLFRYDRKWLEANLPPRKPSPGPPCRINWEQRDDELAARVISTAANLIDMPGKPVRVSATAIAKELGVLHVIHKRPNLLPQTIRAISGAAETIEGFAIRRIRWTALRHKEEGIRVSRTELQIRSAVSTPLWQSQIVQAAIASIMRDFGS